MTLFTAVREEKNRDIVFREVINTMETRPISPKGVFCSRVYYTKDDTYKDCYIQQGCSQQGAFRTSALGHSPPASQLGCGVGPALYLVTVVDIF
jgi:hypothetical protein